MTRKIAPLALIVLITCSSLLKSQSNTSSTVQSETPQEQVQRLTTAMAQAQAQMEANQKLLIELQQQLAVLQLRMAVEKAAAPGTAAATQPAVPSLSTPSTLEEIREKLAIDESQIATHDLTKVETESKYPLTVSGMLLFNAFVNTRQVDVAAAPAYTLQGSGSTGFSLRQTVLGFDAHGPHVFGAASHADVRVDFFANGVQPGYSSGILRLRTMHAALQWPNTEAFVELDRTILVPNAPTSLLAVGQPELAWSGNLWVWNPQVGVSRQIGLRGASRLQAEVALIEAGDPLAPGSTGNTSSVTRAQRSRWPGTEARIAWLGGLPGTRPEIGVGGYFSPHRTDDGVNFDAWAATIDAKLPLTRYFEMTANAYRGQALGGLGGGGYVDYVYRYLGSTEIAHALDDVGGWAQLKARASNRMELNAGFGIDNPFAKEIDATLVPFRTGSYSGLARNRSYFANAIYSPSAYLLFSIEYRRLLTNYATGPTYPGDVIGIGAGYKF